MKTSVLFLSLLFVMAGCCAEKQDPSAILLEKDNITRLIPHRAQLNGGVTLFMPNEPYKSFWAEGWNRSSQSIQWKVATDKDEYNVAALISANNLDADEQTVLELSNGSDKVICSVSGNGWQRCWFDKPVRFSSGTSDLSLRILTPGKSPKFNIHLYSLEVVKPAANKQLMAEAAALRSDVTWMGDIKYGFFFHWNSKSMPRRGEQKTYNDAVNDFDVDKFAFMVNNCGAKLIFFTTSWAEYYFPAPIKAIDSILPGRTATRDLVADLSDALNKYGIKLILYYHVGHGDKEWWDKQHFTLENSGDLYTNLERIVGEVSMRYGSKLAGLWMDDGMGYYPNMAPFDKITYAAKRGNKNLVICYNPWIFPQFTEFQDYYAGEVGLSVESSGRENPYLPVGGNGIFTDGPQKGLQATYTGVLEPGEWTHIYKDTDIPAPLFGAEELTRIIRESNGRKNLPMMNIRVYQDGSISPLTYKLLKDVKQALDVE